MSIPMAALFEKMWWRMTMDLRFVGGLAGYVGFNGGHPRGVPDDDGTRGLSSDGSLAMEVFGLKRCCSKSRFAVMT